MVLAGGHTESTDDVTPQVREVAEKIKEDLKKNVLATASGEDGQAAERQQFDAYDILEFRQQVVAGMVYHMKIRLSASTGECVHVRVFQPLPYTGLGPEIQKWELHATADDPLNTL